MMTVQLRRVADGNIVIVAHHSNQKRVGTSQAHKEIELGSTPREKSSSSCGKQIGQHFWYDDQGLAGFRAGEDKEKEIHRGVQSLIQKNDSHDGGSGHRSGQVDQEEDKEEKDLQIPQV